MSQPFFSIVITSYNRADLLMNAVDSVLNQSYQDFEIIIVDDASTDDTIEVIKGISDTRVTLLKHEENLGSIHAKNNGIVAAKGKYICLLDSDDEFYPEKLNLLYQKFISLKAHPIFIFGGWQWEDFESATIRVSRKPDQLGKINNLPRWCFNILPDMVEAEFFKKNLYNPKVRSYEQFEVLIKLFQEGRVEYIKEIISRFRDHSGVRSSQNLSKRLDAIDHLFRNHKKFIKTERKFCSNLMLTKGLYQKNLSIEGYYKSLMKSILYYPLQYRSYYHILKAIFS